MTIGAWLTDATKQLKAAEISSASLDSEIILAHTLKKPRTYLHAHTSDDIDPRVLDIATARLDLRLDHVPLAYIIGHKEFYGHLFSLTPHVLIPRPESEMMLTMLADSIGTTQPLPGIAHKQLVDIGTGSGCLGISAKLQHPDLNVTLIDTSRAALAVAEKNARQLGADVEIIESDLLDGYPYAPDIVLANLPYVDPSWERSAETNQEPPEALFADDQGLAIIRRCFEQLQVHMRSGSFALFEADPRQWESIEKIARENNFDTVTKSNFVYKFTRR